MINEQMFDEFDSDTTNLYRQINIINERRLRKYILRFDGARRLIRIINERH